VKHLRLRLTYANLMSSIAVFLVLGGAAVAAVNLPGNSVGTRQLKKNAVKTGKVSFEAIRAGKLSKDAVSTNRLRDEAVTGDKVSSSIQKSGDLLFATVAPANAAAAIVRGRGALSVTRVVNGSFIVTFNRDITGCTWLATYGQPNNGFVDARWATVRGRAGADQVGVVLRNQNGAQVDGAGFHVAAFCP
jgi:hypothetical protein